MLEILKSVYKGQKVFVTGHTGFKGSWLLKALVMLGADVKGYALETNSENNLYNLIDGNNLCQSVIADLRDKARLAKEIDEFRPDYVFHLAAQPLVRLSYEIPAETFEVNTIGTANVLDGVRALNKPCFAILITTDKVYQNNEWVYPYRENDRLGGYDPYSASKACAEILIESYKLSFFNSGKFQTHQKAIAVGRAGNVIGGGDWSRDRLIPDIIKALAKNKAIEIRNPHAVRPWQHVLEPVIAYLLLGAKVKEDPIKFAAAYNFGPLPSDTLPVIKMVELAISNWGKGEVAVVNEGNQVHEAGLLKLDINKAAAELNWVPKMDAKAAVKLTIDWYKEYFTNRNNISNFTERQITDFLSI